MGAAMYPVWREPESPDDHPHDINHKIDYLKGSKIREFKKGYWVSNVAKRYGYYVTNNPPPTHSGVKA